MAERPENGKSQPKLDEYYQVRGWNKEVVRSRQKLEGLNLGVARITNELHRSGRSHLKWGRRSKDESSGLEREMGV